MTNLIDAIEKLHSVHHEPVSRDFKFKTSDSSKTGDMATLRLVTLIFLLSLVGVKSQNISWPTSESPEESEEVAGFAVRRKPVLESSSCDGLWSIINQNGVRWGLLVIPDPKFGTNSIKMQFSYSGLAVSYQFSSATQQRPVTRDFSCLLSVCAKLFSSAYS